MSKHRGFRPTSTETAYVEALENLRGRKSRMVDHNTEMVSDYDGVRVYLHHKPIIHYTRGEVRVNSCGWRTHTTKSRMNSLLPPGISVYQCKHVWYVGYLPNNPTDCGYKVFVDGMKV